jgi:hypothetical protein
VVGDLRKTATTARSPLDDRRFRGLLLAIAGIPIAAAYVWFAILQPILLGGYLGDFQESYMRAAARLTAGQDPYDLCQTMGCLEPTGPQYVMPPLLAWLLQPLVGLDVHAIEVGVVAVLNCALVLFLWLVLRALRAGRGQLAVLIVLIALAFEPTVANVEEGQVNLVLLALSGAWLWAWIDDRWWGGLTLGAAIALKLIQGPVVLLLLWGRRWRMLAATAASGLVLWAAGAPRYLYEYLSQVLPAVSAGTGLFENHSPGGTIARLFDPNTFFGADRGSPPPARVVTVIVALAVLGVTFAVLRSPSRHRNGRGLEAAAIVAATPLVATYSWGTHLVLLLLPISVLVAWAVPRRDWAVLGLTGAGWLLIGPGHKELQTLLVSGYPDLAVLRIMAELGVVGITVIWVASLVALRRQASADRADAAHEQRADAEQDDRAGEHDPVAGVW